MKSNTKTQQRNRRRSRIRARISGTALRPRLSVFKSNTTLYAQLVDDTSGKTLASVSTRAIASKERGAERAHACGVALAEKALGMNIKAIVFDRGGYIYTGNVKALAEGAREAGLKF